MPVVTFDTDPTGPWTVGSLPGIVRFGHLYPGTDGVGFTADTAYVTDMPVTGDIRLSMKAHHSPEHLAGAGRGYVGAVDLPPTFFIYFAVSDTIGLLHMPDGTFTFGAPPVVDWTAGPHWFTLDVSADGLHAEGGVWASAPPESGGTPDYSLVGTSAIPSPNPLFAYFGGGGVARINPADILEDDTWYDDWTVGGGGPPPPEPTRLLVAGGASGGLVRNVGR